MKSYRTNSLLILAAALVLLGIGWAWYAYQSSLDDTAAIPNPASVYCESEGGVLQIVDEEGGQVGYCRLPDGRVCEEWALYRDRVCNPPIRGY